VVYQESQRKVALLEAMVIALRDRLKEQEGSTASLAGDYCCQHLWLRVAALCQESWLVGCILLPVSIPCFLIRLLS
jgi:hypothetical protein